MKFIETGFAVIKNSPDTEKEKVQYVTEIKKWLSEYEATPVNKMSTF